METILKAIGLFLIFLLGIMFMSWFLVVLAIIVLMFGIAWACGIPITITRAGKKIGYYKRTKFYPAK